MDGFLFEAHGVSKKMARISQRAKARRLVREGGIGSCGTPISRARSAKLPIRCKFDLVLLPLRDFAFVEPFANGRQLAPGYSGDFCLGSVELEKVVWCHAGIIRHALLSSQGISYG